MSNSANVLQVLNLESHNPPASSSTSLKRMQIPFPNPKKNNFPLITAAIVSAGVAHTFRSRNSILSTVGGGGGGPLPIELFSYPVNADEDDKSHEITKADLKDKHEVLAINSGGQVVMVGSCFQKDSGGTYTETKGQLQKLLEKGGDLEAGTNPGGTTKGLRPVKEHTLGSFSSSWHWDKENGGVTYMPQEDDVKTECNIVSGCGGPLTLIM